MVWPALIAAAASYVGGRQQNAANKAMADTNREWQQMMSSSAHQREVRDLKRAGLNPILSATGGMGASTPPGSMAMMTNPMGDAVNSAMAAQRTQDDTALTRARKAVTETENILKKQLIPGAKGIATITGQITNLLKAAESLIGKSGPGYKETLQSVTETIVELTEKGTKFGASMYNIIESALNERSELTQKYFEGK